MPRAHRYFLPGHLWHITHRCHKKEFLLKFARDREQWRHWLFEAKKRYGLSVLNYVITSNHVHLLVRDMGKGEISKSMQLIAGRTAQQYNKRKGRSGSYWEDRYHATAIDTDSYFARCMVYIDLNMVRAGVVEHPEQWTWAGYQEIQYPPKRYNVIDQKHLQFITGTRTFEDFQRLHKDWLDSQLQYSLLARETEWTTALAIGSKDYVNAMKGNLGISAKYRLISKDADTYVLREQEIVYKP